MAEQYIMSDNGAVLTNPGTGHEPYGVWRDVKYGWNPIISTPISFTGSDINKPSSFHNNLNGAVIPYFDSDHVCQGVLTITSADNADPITFSTSEATRTRVPQAGDYLLSPQYDFTVARCLFVWADIEAVESSFDWTAMEKVNGVKVVRELNRIIGLEWIDRKKKQIAVHFAMDYPLDEPGDTHAGDCPSQSGMTSTQVKLAADASASDDTYNTGAIYIIGGTGIGQVRTVSDYDGTNKIVTVSSAWSTQPDDTSDYYVTQYRQLPDWLVEDIACDGVAYVWSGSAGFSPNYDNATLIAKHGLLLAAFGTQYSGDEIFQRALFGSLGHWGELHIDYTISGGGAIGDDQVWTDVLANAIVNQYLDHYDDAFGAEYCETRRSIGDSGTMGFGTFCHGFGDDSQVWTIRNGGIDSMVIGCNDSAGITQAAISGWAARHKSIEPYGSPIGNNPDQFRDEPTTIVTTDDMTKWEANRWSASTGNSATDARHWRTKADYAMSVVGGAEYQVKIRPSNYAADGVGYKCRVVEYQSNDTFVKSSSAVANNQKITLAANTGKVRFSVHFDNDNSTTMTEAYAKDSNLRFYATSGGGDELTRNIEWAMKQLEDYKPLIYCEDLCTATVVAGGGTAANVATFLKKIGYRLGLTVDSPTDASVGDSVGIDVTIHNTGVAQTWLPGYYLEVALVDSAGPWVVANTAIAIDDFPVGDTPLDTIYLNTSGAYLGTFDITVAIYHPDFTSDLYVDFYGGTAYGMRYTTTELVLNNYPKEVSTGADITPSIAKEVGKNISANAAVTPSVTKDTGKSISADSVITPSMLKEAEKSVSVDVAATPTITKTVEKGIEVEASAIPSVTKEVEKGVITNVDATPVILKDAEKTVSVEAVAMPIIRKMVSKTIGIDVAATPVIVKDTEKNITVDVTGIGSLQKQSEKVISATVESAGTILRGVGKTISVSATGTPEISKGVEKAISVDAEITPTIQKGVEKTIEAVSNTTPTIKRKAAKSISTTVEAAGTVWKDILKRVSVAVEATCTIAKDAYKALSTAVETELDITKDVSKSVAVSVEASNTLQKQASKIAVVEVSISEDITKNVGKKLMAVVVADNNINRNVSKVVLVSALAENTLQKTIAKTLDTSVAVQPDIHKHIDKIISTNIVITNELIKNISKTLTVVVVAVSPVYSTDYFYQCIVECIERELTLTVTDGEEW